MPFELLEFHIDGDYKFDFKRCLFEFKGRKFLIIINENDEYCDLILSISKKDDTDATFNILNNFLCSYAYENHCSFNINTIIAKGIDNCILSVNQGMSSRISRFYRQNKRFERIINIQTGDQEKALSLLNEGDSNNNEFYKFLCYWRIFEIRYKKGEVAVWIDNLVKKMLFTFGTDIINDANTNNLSIGQYLYKYFRCAIAHCKQNPLKLNNNLADKRLTKNAAIEIRKLDEYFIKNELGIPIYANKIQILEMKKY